MTDNGAIQIADVYRGLTFAGKITRTRNGSIFEYDKGYLENADPDGGIAYNLPRTRGRVETVGVNLHTFFAGLLPEGLRLEALIRGVKTSRDDLLSLLIASGADCIGDISVVKEHGELGEVSPDADIGRLDKVSFLELFERSVSNLDGEGGVGREISIPGVQEKISAGLITFPLRTKKETKAYILKLNPKDKPRLVENEAFFLGMARECGLSVAGATVVRDREDNSGLLVERFDRAFIPETGTLAKIHQEDACQFLDRYPADKYTFVDCRMIAEGIENFSSAPVVEIAKLIRLIAFSYLIGNGDLHAKNVSLRTSRLTGRIELSPAYDILSTLPYGDRRMALKFEGRDDNLSRRDFINFGKRSGVRKAATISILDELCEKSRPWINRLDEIGLEGKKLSHLKTVIAKRRDDLG